MQQSDDTVLVYALSGFDDEDEEDEDEVRSVGGACGGAAARFKAEAEAEVAAVAAAAAAAVAFLRFFSLWTRAKGSWVVSHRDNKSNHHKRPQMEQRSKTRQGKARQGKARLTVLQSPRCCGHSSHTDP